MLFINRGKSPLFYKKQYKRRKSKGKSITSEKTLKKKNLFEIFLSEVMPGKEKEPSSRQEDKNIHLSRTRPSVKKIIQQNHSAFSFFGVYFFPSLCIWRFRRDSTAKNSTLSFQAFCGVFPLQAPSVSHI